VTDWGGRMSASCTISAAVDGHTQQYDTISSCQLSATSEDWRVLLVTSLTYTIMCLELYQCQ